MQDRSASQPLIQSQESRVNDTVPDEESRLVPDADAVEQLVNDDQAPTPHVWRLTVAAGLSGLLFGYDTGVISSTLVSIHDDLGGASLTTIEKSIITSATAFCALIASPVAGVVADWIGRKRLILLTSLLFILGAILQSFATTVTALVIGRGIVGLAVGAASFVVPIYIGELAPKTWRGRLVTLSALFITGGQVVAYVVGWIFFHVPNGWRWMVGLGAAPAVLQMLLLSVMPESARWLVRAGRRKDAEKVLGSVYGNNDRAVQAVLGTIEQSLAEDKTVGERLAAGQRSVYRDLFAIGRNRRALMIACLLQTGQQIGGFNALMYFSASIFATLGFSNPTLASLVVAVTNFVFTIIAFTTIDRFGRRSLLLWSIPFMVLGHLLTATAFGFVDIGITSDGTQDSEPTSLWASSLLIASFMLFVAAYAIGIGNVPWQQGELFPLRVRSVGSSISTSTNWLANSIVGFTFLPMMTLLTPPITFVIYGGICIVVWYLLWRCYPETSGMSLEEVGVLLDDGWGVEKSAVRWRAEIASRRR